MIHIEEAIELLRNGEVVAFPTETVYGLGADAWNPSAVKKVFDIKGRPADNPLIVHLASREMAGGFAAEIPETARTLMDRYWPGPLTLIFKKKPEVLDLITGGLDTVALRWPNHPLSQELIFRAGPLVAPSANKSGRPSPTKAEHVLEDFGENFPVIDGGTTQIGLESTVLDVSEKPCTIYRPGYIGKKEIEKTTGEEVKIGESTPPDETRSPGTRYSHYAPNARVRWLEENEQGYSEDTLYLVHSRRRNMESEHDNLISYRENYERMANELYDRFRQADHDGYKSIAVEQLPVKDQNHGIVQALRNRISKAIGG